MLATRKEHGAALLAMLLIVALGASYFMVSRMHAMSIEAKAAERAYNAAVLNRAKQALIGYVAAQAVKAGENNPGALPCPEAAAYFDNPANEGQVASSCTLPKVGRLPWRTLGLDKLTDAAGEPLWYVVSPGWGYTGTNSSINSDTKGQLTLDGVAGTDSDTIVALIIAPGPAISAAAATGCTAWAQSRPTTGTPDWRNYLECENATSPPDAAFVSTGPSGSFNDQLLALTKGEIMPAIEAAISDRIEREIAPALKSVYASAAWASNLSAANPMYPYPAPFANPGATASYQGSAASCAANLCRGLFPVIFANVPVDPLPNPPALCTPAAGSPCDPMFVRWTSGTIEVKSVDVAGTTYVPGNIYGMTWTAPVSNCAVVAYGGSMRLECTTYVPGLTGNASSNIIYEVKGTALNVGMALRRFETAPNIPGLTLQTPPTPSVAMNSNGSASTTFRGRTSVAANGAATASQCGLGGTLLAGVDCRQMQVNVPLEPLFPDHPLANSRDGTLGRFMRNEWYRVMYYAVAQGDTAGSLPTAPACAPPNCITVANVTPTGRQRAIFILAGRSVNGAARPSATLTDYLEFGNATAAFESQTVSRAGPAALKRPFNDRIVVVDTN